MITSLSVKLDFDRKKNVLATHPTKGIFPAVKRAIESGECLRVMYWGGSQPGEVRELVPLNILSDRRKVLARCEATKMMKHYIMDKMELVSIDDKETYVSHEEGIPFDIELRKHVYLFFQFTSFKVEIENGELQVYEAHKNNPSRFKMYPFMTIDYASMQKMKFRFSIQGWHRSFSGIEEAVAFAMYYLHIASNSLKDDASMKAS